MTEFAYIEHLNIHEKRRGSILHAEEYNATVGKINEIVDSLQASYNYNNSLPNFDEISDISQINTENGTPVIIHNVGEKYYPVTSSAYVTVGDNKYLDTELTYIKSELDNVKNDVESIEIPSYYGSYTINIDDDNVISVNTSYVIDEIIDGTTLVNANNKITVNPDVILHDVIDNVITNANDIAGIQDELSNIQSKIDGIEDKSYYGSTTININDNNEISVNVSELVGDNSYVTVENNKIKFDDEALLQDVNSKIDTNASNIDALNTKIDTEIGNVQQDILSLSNIVNDFSVPSYYGSDTVNVEDNIISVNVDNIIDGSYLTVEDNKIKLDSESLLSDVNSKIDTNASNITTLDTKIDTEIDNVQQDVLALSNIVNDLNVPSYYGTDTIDINDNQISVNTSYLISYIIDNDTIIAYNDKIKVNAEEVISELSEDIENKINHVNDLIEDVSNVVQQLESSVSYFPGDGINIDENNVISLDTSYLIEDVEKPSIYLNEDGKLVVNNEVVLANAESQFKFIDENGNWVGDMANVKNYIDEHDTALDNKMDNIKNEIYTYMSKFTEYDTLGKDYAPSVEFINRNKNN